MRKTKEMHEATGLYGSGARSMTRDDRHRYLQGKNGTTLIERDRTGFVWCTVRYLTRYGLSNNALYKHLLRTPAVRQI